MNHGHRIRIGFVCVLAALACAVLMRPAAAADSEFADFRIPKHRWSTWIVDFSGGGRTNHSEFEGQTFDDGVVSGSLRSSSEWGFDSDRIQHRLGLAAYLSGNRRHVERTLTDTLGRRDSEISQHDVTESVVLQVSSRLYPWRFPLGVDVSGTGDVTFGQSTADSDEQFFTPSRVTSKSHDGSDYNRQYVSAGLTLGVGRVRDATGVYRAWLLEHRLRATGNLTRGLSSDAKAKLAALFYVENSFRVPHDLPVKFFWREVERILREDGALESGALDAYTVYRVIEPAFEKRFVTRNTGFFVGPSVTVNDLNDVRHRMFRNEFIQFDNDSVVSRLTNSRSQRRYFHDAFVAVGAHAEYHVPIDLRWQFDAASSLQYVDEFDRLAVGTATTLSYLIADRWYADTGINHQWGRLGSGGNAREEWSVRYGASVSYFLEDAWRIGVAWEGTNNHQGDRDASTQQFSLGISYHITGALDVPGVVDPVRLMRVTP